MGTILENCFQATCAKTAQKILFFLDFLQVLDWQSWNCLKEKQNKALKSVWFQSWSLEVF